MVKSLSRAQKKYLKEIFSNPKEVGSLGGITPLYNRIKSDGRYQISLQQLKRWLMSQETYTLHNQYKTRFKRNRVIVGELNQQWDLDIADLAKLAKYNKNFKYFLLAIDVLSKYIRVVPLKTKGAVEVTNAFKTMIEKVQPQSLHSDRGTEFTNATFQNFLNTKNIKHFHTNNELKAMVAERAIKTIKLKIYKYFTESKSYKWIDVINDIVKTYNNTVHHSTGVTPASVTLQNQNEIWNKLYPNELSMNQEISFKYNINDNVRVSYIKTTFQRAYDYFWTGEIFTITERFFKEMLPKYRLKDWNNDPIAGTFYEEELQKVVINNNTEYRIEKILRRRTQNGRRQVLVKWFLWPDRFNSWIDANTVQRYG